MYYYRTATPTDADSLQQLLNTVFERMNSPPIASTFFSNPNCYPLVVTHHNKVVGTASMHFIQKIDRLLAQIEDVAIAPEHQGKQLGKQLLHQLIAEAKARGAYKIILNTAPSTTPFYKKLGFEEAEVQMKIKL